MTVDNLFGQQEWKAARTTKENTQNFGIFQVFLAPAKNVWDGPKWGREVFFPANPDLANFLGDMDFDFENLYVFVFFGSQISGLGPAGAQLGPGLGPAVGPAWAINTCKLLIKINTQGRKRYGAKLLSSF